MMATSKVGRGFKIVDNVVIGDEVPLNQEPTNVGELLLEALKNKPNFIGQVDGVTGEEQTYQQMRERSVKCAMWLKKQGVGSQDIIGICVSNLLDAYVPVFAGFYLNAIVNPWDEQLTIMTARTFLSLSSPKVVFVNASSASNVLEAAKQENLDVKVIVFEDSSKFVTLTNILNSEDTTNIDNFQCAKIESPNETCLICNTSGTTGLPKGAEISHLSLINYVYLTDMMDLRDHVSMWLPPLRWHYGLSLVVKAVLDYSTRIVVDHYISDEVLCEIMQKYKVTWFGSGPAVPVRLLKHGIISKFDLSSLKVFVVGGSHFKREPQEALRKCLPGTAILQTYGMTDIGGVCNHQRKDSKPGSCGPVCKNIRLKVVDPETGKVLGPNERGELLIKSPYVMNGYYKNPEAVKQFIDAEGYAHSGDIGYYDEDGELFLVGRTSEFIIYKSINVPPAQIEALLETHPAVLEAAVVPVPHETDDEHPMAFVLKVPGKQVTEEELIRLVEENLEYYSRLHGGVKFVDELPRTTTGKISRRKLKEIAAGLPRI